METWDAGQLNFLHQKSPRHKTLPPTTPLQIHFSTPTATSSPISALNPSLLLLGNYVTFYIALYSKKELIELKNHLNRFVN
ncbi:hypothetical protein Pint_17816 [Pistacia integerrima]|uniref:Uncharacterized protein n=1 Tax=Pistacia integerrima TaxID=434235 RepID=A0ACC0YVQ4_9ROSI|nr:hypothetical protein Pint_17816 [Pistacia integerrima]